MLTYDDIDFIKLIECLDKHLPFSIPLHDGYIKRNLIIQNDNPYDTFPLSISAFIIGIARIDFNIEHTNSYNCNILNIHSNIEGQGIGSLLFSIMYNYLYYKKINKVFHTHSIFGTLSQVHHDNNSWIKSIPFYIKQSYFYNLEISFLFSNQIIRLSKNNHPEYMNYDLAKELAAYISQATNTANFELLL